MRKRYCLGNTNEQKGPDSLPVTLRYMFQELNEGRLGYLPSCLNTSSVCESARV